MRKIKLTAKQKECVDYKGQHMVVQGIPGSGKSVVLLQKAIRHAKEGKGAESVGVFTFNKTLAKYARDLVEGLDVPGLEIIHFHRWARGKLAKLRVYPFVPKGKALRDIIRKQIQAEQARRKSARVLQRDLEFWQDEFRWIKGKLIEDLDTYLKTDRAGRGSALRMADRKVVWQVYQGYQNALHENRQMDWDDFAVELYRRIDRLPDSEKIDHVLVDEGQDLHESQLKVLRAVSRKTLTIVADEAQRIYKTSFTWKGLDINVRGSGSKRLTTSFRSTKQIITLAADLRKRDKLAKENDPDTLLYELPKTEGPKPKVISTQTDKQEDELVVALVRQLIESHTENGEFTETIGILAREWYLLKQMESSLKRAGIDSERIEDEEGNVTTPGVKLTTLHSAKGLEFNYVICMRLNEGVVPPNPSEDLAPEDLEEFLGPERRLLYVSMTRAKYELYLTHSQPKSRFLDELDPELYD